MTAFVFDQLKLKSSPIATLNALNRVKVKLTHTSEMFRGPSERFTNHTTSIAVADLTGMNSEKTLRARDLQKKSDDSRNHTRWSCSLRLIAEQNA